MDGNRLRRLRNAADYDAEVEKLQNRTQRAVHDAEVILNALARV